VTQQIFNTVKYNEGIAPLLKELDKPLSENFSFSFFAYRRFYNDGQLLYLFNNPKWMEFCFQTNSWYSNNFWQKVDRINGNNYIIDIWPDTPHNDLVFNSMYEFDIWNGLVYYIKHDNYIETFTFSSTRDNPQVKQFYLNNLELLNSYITYFKSKGHELINNTDKRILLPYPSAKEHNAPCISSATNNFLNQTRLKFYSVSMGARDVLLTRREMDCLYCLSRGKTIKETAKLLGISPRTVEYYINLAKEKTRIMNSSELIQAFLKNQTVVSSYHLGS
jgi:DNA-binding CsgD family transcriptional regulator